MAIKAGQILHAMNMFIVDRIQTAGGTLNIPTEKIYELGNHKSVAIVRDAPELSFSLDVLDVACEVEALLTGSTTEPDAQANGTLYDLAKATPVTITSPWRGALGTADEFNTVKGVVLPHLTLESASYRYGLRENAGESFTLRGDSIFYVPGSPFAETPALATGSYSFANGPALPYVEQGTTRYALSVSAGPLRLTAGLDYTETAAGVTLTAAGTAAAAGNPIKVAYGSAVATPHPQASNDAGNIAVKPAAIRGKDIQVYVQLPGAAAFRWSDVQAVTVDWRVTIEDDFEFGNPNAVSREATDAPVVTGTIELKPMTSQRFFDKLAQVTGAAAGAAIGPQSSRAMEVTIVLLNPDSGGTTAVAKGTPIKTIRIPDARFTIPGYEGRVQQKMTATLAFESDTGTLEIYNEGAAPASALVVPAG